MGLWDKLKGAVTGDSSESPPLGGDDLTPSSKNYTFDSEAEDLANYEIPPQKDSSLEKKKGGLTGRLKPDAEKSDIIADIGDVAVKERISKSVDATLEPLNVEEGTIPPLPPVDTDYLTYGGGSSSSQSKRTSKKKTSTTPPPGGQAPPTPGTSPVTPGTPPVTPGTPPVTPGTPPVTPPVTPTPGTPPVTPTPTPSTPPVTPTPTPSTPVNKPKLLSNLRGNLFGTPMDDIDYARRGGYIWGTKDEIDAENVKLLSTNDTLTNVDLVDANQKVRDEKIKRDAAWDNWDNETDQTKKKAYLVTLKAHEAELVRLTKIRDDIVSRINKNNTKIEENRRHLVEYQKILEAEKKRSSTRSQVGKKLRLLGEGAADVQSGVFGGRMTKQDWFGKEGFLKYPYKQSTMTMNVTEPVKAKMSRLTDITSSTGKVVGAGAITAATTVKPNKNIAFMGAPGTVAGARQQFDYNIPARRISLLEVSGISKGGNVNPDILPNLYDVPKQEQISPLQYKQVVQPDGTVVNVPVQQRAQKLFAVSVNRYPSGIKITGMRVNAVSKPFNKPVNKPVKNSNRLVRGIENVGTVSNSGIAKLKFGNETSNMNRLIRGVENIGSSKIEKVIPDVKLAKKRFGLGLLNIKDVGLIVRDPTKKTDVINIEPIREYRKSKKNSSLVKLSLNLTGVKLSKNLNKFTLKNKTK